MSDLISRQDAISELYNINPSEDFLFIDAIVDMLENLSEKSKQKWIPITEALPEEDEEVLVTVRFDGTKDVKSSTYVETASQIGGSWTSYSDEWKISRNRHHIIAWMPLPEPWRGD